MNRPIRRRLLHRRWHKRTLLAIAFVSTVAAALFANYISATEQRTGVPFHTYLRHPITHLGTYANQSGQFSNPASLNFSEDGQTLFVPVASYYNYPDSNYLEAEQPEMFTAQIKGVSVVFGKPQQTQMFDSVLNADRKVANSSDQRRQLTLETLESIQILDAATGQRRSTFLGSDSLISKATLDPTGAFIAGVREQKNGIGLWEAKTGKRLQTLALDMETIDAIAFSTSGEQIAIANSTTLQIWILSSQNEQAKQLQTIPLTGSTQISEDSQLLQLKFNSNNTHITTLTLLPRSKGSAWKQARLQQIDLKTGNVIHELKKFRFHGPADISPDGKMLANALNSGSDSLTSGAIELIEIATGERKTLIDNIAALGGLEYLPNGSSLVTASYDNKVSLYDNIQTGTATVSIPVENYNSGLAVSSDGRHVLVRLDEGAIAEIDTAQLKVSRTFPAAQGMGITHVEMGEKAILITRKLPALTAQTLQASSPTNQLLLEKIESNEGPRELPEIKISSNGRVFAVFGKASSDSAQPLILLGDGETGEITRRVNPSEAVRDLTFSPNGKVFATVSEERTVTLWNAQTGEVINQLKSDSLLSPPRSLTRHNLTFSSDGSLLAFGDSSGVQLWQVASGDRLRTFTLRDDDEKNIWMSTQGLAISPDNKWIAADAGHSQKIYFWQISTGELLRVMRTRTSPDHLAFSPDKRMLAAASEFGEVSLWQLPNRLR